MENKGTILKLILATVLIVLIVALAYAWTSGGDTSTNLEAVKKETNSQDFLSSLVNLKNISLDTSFMRERAYASLIDLGVALSPQPKGRDNPFAPFSGFVTTGAMDFSGEDLSDVTRSGPPKPTKSTEYVNPSSLPAVESSE